MNERIKALLTSKDMGLALTILGVAGHGFADGKLTAHQAIVYALLGLATLGIGEALAALRAALVKDGAPAPVVSTVDALDVGALAEKITTNVMVHLPEVAVEKADALRTKIKDTIEDHIGQGSGT